MTDDINYQQETVYHNVAVQDGFAYVPTGITIKMEYTGIPLGKTVLSIPGVGPDYGTLLGGYYRPVSSKDKQMMLRFPYQNVEEFDPDAGLGKYYWFQCNGVSPSDLVKLTKQFEPDYEPLIVEFEIYQRYKLECGFPKKCGEMTSEEARINGFCGLENFCKTPVIIDRNGITDPALQKKYMKDVKLQVTSWRSDLKKALTDSWDYSKNLANNTWNKTVTLQNFVNIANMMLPGLQFIPQECLKSICEAQRKAAGENTINAMNKAAKNKINSTELLIDETKKTMEEMSTKSFTSALGDLGESVGDTLSNIAGTISLYTLCPRRFKDWLKSAVDASGVGQALDEFAQVQNKLMDDLLGGFEGILGNCITDGLQNSAINAISDLASTEKNQLLSTLKSGDMDAFKSVINGSHAKDAFLNKATGLVSLTTTINTPTFNMNKLTGLSNNLMSKLKSVTEIGSSSDAFNLISNIRNAEYNMTRIYFSM